MCTEVLLEFGLKWPGDRICVLGLSPTDTKRIMLSKVNVSKGRKHSEALKTVFLISNSRKSHSHFLIFSESIVAVHC